MSRKAFATGVLLAFVFTAAVSVDPQTTEAVTSVSVRSFGAKGDGRTDDTIAFRRAMRAAAKAHATLFVPPGTYKANVAIPSGVTVRGAGMKSSWLKGKITYGSNCVVRDIKLGDAGYSVQHRNGASNTSFTRCRFRGGGGATTNAAVLLLGNTNSGHHFTFTDCDFERNCGTEDAVHSLGYNIVSLNNEATSGGVQIDYVTWKRCHFGVDNGLSQVATPRAGIEATNRLTPAVKGYSYISVIDCVFEKTGIFSIDFADAYNKSNNVVIRGNLIKGAGVGHHWGYAVCLEMPIGSIVEDNTFYRCYSHPIKFAYSDGVTNNSIIRNNTFHLDVDNGITPQRAVFYITGGGTQIYGNTIVMDYNERVWEFFGAYDTAAYSNTVTHKYAGASAEDWAAFSDSTNVRVAGTGTDSTRNALETYQTSAPGWLVGSGNSNITTSPNTLIPLNRPAFVGGSNP